MKISEVVPQTRDVSIYPEAGLPAWLQTASNVYRTITGGQFFDKVKATLGKNFGSEKARIEYNNILISGALVQSFLANTKANGNKNPSSEDLAQFLIDAGIHLDYIQMAFQKVTPGKTPEPEEPVPTGPELDPDVDYDQPAFQRKADELANQQAQERPKQPKQNVRGDQGILDANGRLIQPESVIYEENKVLNKKEILRIVKQAVTIASERKVFNAISIPSSAANPEVTAKQLVQAVANNQNGPLQGPGDAEVVQAVKDIKSMSPEQRAQLTKELQG